MLYAEGLETWLGISESEAAVTNDVMFYCLSAALTMHCEFLECVFNSCPCVKFPKVSLKNK